MPRKHGTIPELLVLYTELGKPWTSEAPSSVERLYLVASGLLEHWFNPYLR